MGDLNTSLRALFGELRLTHFQTPEGKRTFAFTKVGSPRFEYVNLSGGERAAFEILLDLVVSEGGV